MPPRARYIPNRSVLGRNVPDDLPNDDLLKKMTAYVKKQITQNNHDFVNIASGDTVVLESEAGYRNNGVFMWNGKKVINLYTDVDDYGSVPPEIEISDDNDFTAYSWENLVDHNNFIWYSPEIRDRIKDALNENLQSRVNIRRTSWTFHIDVNQERPTVEEVKRALYQNRVIFTASDNNNNIEMFVSNQVHGKPRRRAPTASSRTTARSRTSAAAAAASTAAEEERQRATSIERRRLANIARIEAELAAVRDSVAELERELAAARVGGGRRNKK